jgi:thiamine biosynthesis lipoprotein
MQLTRRKLLAGTCGLLVTACGLAPSLPATGGGRKVVAFGGPAFGTYWRITLPRVADKAAVRLAVEAIVTSVDQSMSPFRAGTEISRFNAMDSGELLPVSKPFEVVVVESLRVAGLTGGAFDPTVGPLVNRYGFGPVTGEARASFADITTGSAAIGKARRNVTLDLCGIAKGYALEKIANAIDLLGIRDFVIELGGEVFARGAHPQGRPWGIAIERPTGGAGVAQRIVHLDGQALATSSDAINAYTFADRRYSHIIDARRGAPIDNGIASASVIARSAMEADALATALMVLGPRRGVEFASRHNVPTLMLMRDGGHIRELIVAGFGDYISF